MKCVRNIKMSIIKHISIIHSTFWMSNPVHIKLILVWERPNLMLELQELGCALAMLKLGLLGFHQVCLCVQTAVNLLQPLDELCPPHAALLQCTSQLKLRIGSAGRIWRETWGRLPSWPGRWSTVFHPTLTTNGANTHRTICDTTWVNCSYIKSKKKYSLNNFNLMTIWLKLISFRFHWPEISE